MVFICLYRENMKEQDTVKGLFSFVMELLRVTYLFLSITIITEKCH